MFENEPNEYIYLTINRDKWNIPANELEDVWKEYYIWRGKHINETMSMAPAIAGSAMAERSN